MVGEDPGVAELQKYATESRLNSPLVSGSLFSAKLSCTKPVLHKQATPRLSAGDRPSGRWRDFCSPSGANTICCYGHIVATSQKTRHQVAKDSVLVCGPYIPKPEREDSMNDQTTSTVTNTSRRSILVGSAGVIAAA